MTVLKQMFAHGFQGQLNFVVTVIQEAECLPWVQQMPAALQPLLPVALQRWSGSEQDRPAAAPAQKGAQHLL